MTPTLHHLARVERQRQAARAAEVVRLRRTLPDVVRVLQGFGARRVILFGSVARGDLTGDLDLDLAVEGLRPEDHWRAASEVGRTAGADVDLVPLEGVRGVLAEVIRREGEILLG